MIFRKICNDTSTMSATELAHNFVFVKNREAWYRDFDREIPARDLMREICAKHAAPADADELTDEELDEILYDNLQFGTDDLEGVFALLYMALYGMTDVRAWLERYETAGLPTTNRPEVLQECVNTYGAEAQVDMAVEEMSELTKALLKYRRKEAQGSKDLEEARENILEEVADVIIMLTQLIMIYGGRDLVQETIENKVDRQIKRLANTEGETGSEVAQEVLQPAT